MCRLFGFRSVIPSQAHRSLVHADQSLAAQSERHPDGWGVAWYVDGAPHLIRSVETALTSTLFRRVSGVVSSHTVLAHVRKATQGPCTVLNCHPFQYGVWTFAHNGDIPGFERCREAIEDAIDPRFRRFILGETDSERIFYLFLSILALEVHGPVRTPVSVEPVADALVETVRRVRELADGPDAPKPAGLTLMVTNGVVLAAVEGGRGLHWSTWKTRCAERETCPFHADVCEAPAQNGHVNHLILSSEPVIDENVWTEFEAGEVIGVDESMNLYRRRGSPAPPAP